jgi:hypothetical protein
MQNELNLDCYFVILCIFPHSLFCCSFSCLCSVKFAITKDSSCGFQCWILQLEVRCLSSVCYHYQIPISKFVLLGTN